jgi:glycine/D-amino acid oxidase-like deaminating enzyme/nitrite reductase/ring-hydroxylating ferredoxin subunit
MSTVSGADESYWMDSTESTSYPAVAGGVQADVAVIGGGIAGLCTAWELTRTGRSVVVVEADRIAAGVTGYTTAKLTAQHTLIYARLRKSFDVDTARLYAQSQLEAVEHVADTVDELGIDCGWERVAAYTYTTSPEQAQDIEAEVDAAVEAGVPASLTTETGLPFAVAAAIRVEAQAQFHPRRYLLALAGDLTRRGGRIFERSRVTGLEEGEPCRLHTEAGATIVARDVVVATRYPVFDRALLFSRLVPRRELVVAAAIPAERDPGGMYITQQDNTRSVRTAPYRDGQRLLIITGETFKPGTPGVSDRLERLTAWARTHFAVDTLAYHWAAQDNNTTDHLPYVGPLHPGAKHVWVATGFGGWGMSNGVMASRLLAALLDGQQPAWTKIYTPKRIHPTVEAGSFLRANLAVARHYVGDRLRPSTHADSPADLAPGSGAVMHIRGERCAVYRDKSGRLSAVSAVCTHLGCIVAFNDAERSWDCPCHGSRFTPNGTIINGPATTPLEQRHLD